MTTMQTSPSSSPNSGGSWKGPALFIALGAIMLGVGLYLAYVPAIPPERMGETTGSIVSIHKPRHSNKNRIVTVAYSVDGREYQGELGFYHSGMSQGSKVPLQYDKENPETIAYPGSRSVASFGIVLMGVIFSGVGIFMLKRAVG